MILKTNIKKSLYYIYVIINKKNIYTTNNTSKTDEKIF